MAELKENRKHPRFECEGIAEIHVPGIEKSYPARIEDLSLRGCKLVLLDDTAADDLPIFFEVTFTVHELTFRLRGRSTGFRGARCTGVEFVDLRPRLRSYVLDLVEELAAGNWKPPLQGASGRPGTNVLVMSSKNDL